MKEIERTEQKILQFFSQYELLTFNKRSILLHATDSINEIYYLKSGFVKQIFFSETGNDITINIFEPKSFFPIMLVLGNKPNEYQFECMRQVKVYKAPTSDVLDFIKANPDVTYDLCVRFAKGLNGLVVKFTNTIYLEAYKKVILFILFLAEKYGVKQDIKSIISLELTHSEIASILGLQRETVSRQLEKLSSKKIILYKKNVITINHIEILKSELKKTKE